MGSFRVHRTGIGAVVSTMNPMLIDVDAEDTDLLYHGPRLLWVNGCRRYRNCADSF